MDLVQKRKQLRQRQVEKVKKFRQSNQTASTSSDSSDDKEKRTEHHGDVKARDNAVSRMKLKQKSAERESMKNQIKQELSQESTNIENSDGTVFARVMNIIGPTHMRPVVSGGLWKGTEQITEKKSDCECDDCGQDPCIECGESHHSVKEAKVEAGRSDYGKASVRNKRRFGTSGESPDPMTGKKITKDATRGELIDKRRVEHKAKRGVKEDYYSGTGEKVVARTKKWMDKKGQKGAPGLDAMKARAAEHKAKRGVKEQMEKDNGNDNGNGVDDQQQKQIDSKQKKANQIKKQVLLKKLQAVRQGGGSEIMASYDWRSDKTMRINKILNN